MKNRLSLKRVVVYFFIVWGTIAFVADEANAAIKIVGFGDSITAGWPYLINGEGCQCPLEGYEVQLDELMLANGYNTEVYNYGVSGETTDEALNDARIDSVIAIEEPDYFLLMEGTNDLLSSDPEIVRDNLEIMVDQVLAGGAIPILGTITPDTRPKGLDKGIVATNDLIKALAVEKNVLLSDQYAAVVSDWANLTGDGLHPNEAGYGILAETWYNTLRNQLGIITLNVEGKGEGTVAYSPLGESCIDCSLTYSKGTEITLTANPAPDSVFTSWSGVCSYQGNDPLCVFTVDQNINVIANFTTDTHTVTPAAGVNGSISPPTNQTVNHGATTSFLITPDVNYHINTVIGCSGTLSGNTYTTAPVIVDCAVTASFAIDTHSVIPSAGSNGSISPPTKQTVNHGATTSFLITPDANYHIDTVIGCSGTLSGNTYTTAPVTADCAVTASFAIDAHTVTPSAGANGSISPSIPQTVDHSSTTSFSINPDIGYHVGNISGTCDGTLSGNIFTTDPITSNCTVNAVFTLNTYTVTPFAEGDGSIAPPAPEIINHGSITTFTVTPDEGYTSFVGGTCGGILDVTTYTTNTIISDCTVVANFGINLYLVNVPEGQHGTIAPYGEIFVNHGEILTFTLTPDEDYKIGEVTGCDGTLTENVYTTDDITGSCEITVTFAKDSFPWTMFLPAIISVQQHY